jgi:hypothetical protein
MVIRPTLALALIASSAAAVLAQQPETTGGAVITSEPGKASIVHMVEISTQVVGIDKTARSMMLRGSGGKTVEVVAGDEVRNFDQIKLGDVVRARYMEAVVLKLEPSKGPPGDVSVSEGSSQAKPGEQPAISGRRQITAIAEVTDVDPTESTITLKGPEGKEVTLDVRNPDQFKVVKKGDRVEVTYTQAVALSVEPASAKASPPKRE